ncbi:MAG: threonine synthase [Deltaproteobacteria bacterium]|nr:threonine synthase [Deltaproteobacteria bacterium]
MPYISTRGQDDQKLFSNILLEGLARDSGLFVPDKLPNLGMRMDSLRKFSYQDLAFEIILPFIDDQISVVDLKELISKSYKNFENPEITPLRFLDKIAVLELFHGPTLAFKDLALQFLGNLFEHFLKHKNKTMTILGATSGDTGSAAIHGVKGKEGIKIFILHPKGRVTPIQEKQMTTVLDENVFNIAVEGTFDDCQNIVKQIFADLEFRDRFHLGAINSINWARVMAQIIYYFYATFRFQENYPNQPVYFSVPTGNFGDIFAGYLALKMGLPISKLILATNENDILCRVIKTGDYQVGRVTHTISPSMDIQVASNFERFLFDLVDRDGHQITNLMETFSATGKLTLTKEQIKKAGVFFQPFSITEEETAETIRQYFLKGYLLDPHTAVGVKAAEKSGYSNVICLATAHPAKFSDAVYKATGKKPDIPTSIVEILNQPTRCLDSKADFRAIQKIIEMYSDVT